MEARPVGAAGRASTSARAEAAALARLWLLPLSVGAAAFLLNALVKLPLQLPGHNGLFWITGLALGRLVSRNALGGTAAGAGAILAGLAFDPLEGAEVAAAGIMLDLLLVFRAMPPRPVPLVAWAALAGATANVSVLVAKLLVGDLPHAIVTRGVDVATESYVAFGAISGAIAALVASSIVNPLSKRRQ